MKILLDKTGAALGARPIRQAGRRRRPARNTRLNFEELEALARQIAARTLERGALVEERRPTCRRLRLGRRMAWTVRHGYLARNRDLNLPVGC